MATTTSRRAATRRASSKASSASSVKQPQDSPLKPYPAYQAYRGGCKVSWYYYADRADAEKAAEQAKAEARYLAGQGCDFGYQAPGYQIEGPMSETAWGGKYAGLYEVCVP